MPESFTQPSTQNAGDWSDAELTSAVQAYLGMLYAELEGRHTNKAEVNRALREGLLSARTKGSIEFRMQNISAALYELKMPWIAGYLPARNIGTAVKERLIAILRTSGIDPLEAFVPTSKEDSLEQKVSALRKWKLGSVPSGTLKPAVAVSTTTTFVRDPAVKAWVLTAAGGRCEGCGSPAPFAGQDGLPYLEVHHVTPLSSHGSDRVTNAVALCPNCHRRCHFSEDRDEFKLGLYEKIPRLILEVSEPGKSDTDEFVNIG